MFCYMCACAHVRVRMRERAHLLKVLLLLHIYFQGLYCRLTFFNSFDYVMYVMHNHKLAVYDLLIYACVLYCHLNIHVKHE